MNGVVAMRKVANAGRVAANAAQAKTKSVPKKRLVPVLSESEKKLFAAIETSPAFGEEAFFARHSVLKENS